VIASRSVLVEVGLGAVLDFGLFTGRGEEKGGSTGPHRSRTCTLLPQLHEIVWFAILITAVISSHVIWETATFLDQWKRRDDPFVVLHSRISVHSIHL
jgi:hypothetical protein